MVITIYSYGINMDSIYRHSNLFPIFFKLEVISAQKDPLIQVVVELIVVLFLFM